MERVRLGWVATCALVACLAGCTNQGPLWEAEEVTSLGDLAERFPSAESLVEQAGKVAWEQTDDGYRLTRPAPEVPVDSRWHSTSRGLTVTVSSCDPSAFEVAIPNTGMRIGVRRSEPVQAEAVVLDRALHVRSQGASAEAFFFDTALGVEELLLVRDPSEPVRYELELPTGWRLRRAKGHRPIVEIVGTRGVPEIRLIIDQAWDAEGRTLTPKAAIEGHHLTLSLSAVAHAPILLDPEWQDAGMPNEPRQYASTTLLPSGKVLLAGGLRWDTSNSLASTEMYDPVTGTFEAGPSMSQPRANHTATLLPDGDVLLAGGRAFTGEAVSTADLLDERTGAIRPTSSTLVHGRESHEATLLPDGRVLLVGGQNYDTMPRPAELYDPSTDQFTMTDGLAVGRITFTSTLLPNGNVLVAGGFTGQPNPQQTAAAEVYDLETEQFRPVGAMHQARSGHSALLLSPSGPVLVAGGSLEGLPLSSAETFDLDSGEFTATNGMAVARWGTRANLLPDGTALLVGGHTEWQSATAATEQYDGQTGQFSSAEPLPSPSGTGAATLLAGGRLLVIDGLDTGDGQIGAWLYDGAEPHLQHPPPSDMEWPRVALTATLLADGRVLVVGGGAAIVPAEVFDPASMAFEMPAGQSSQAQRRQHSATRLGDGSVLVAGGLNWNGRALDSVEVFMPESGQFAAVDTLITPRGIHTATTLPDGRVLLTGGVTAGATPNSVSPLASTEIYHPTTRTFAPGGSLAVPRMYHTATLLADGTVLVTGGFIDDALTIATDTAEIFDPRSGSSTLLDSTMPLPRVRHTATALADGNVLIGGGSVGWTLFDSSLREFTPAYIDSVGRFGHSTVRLSTGDVLIAGGWPGGSGDPLQSLELINPTTRTTRDAGLMNVGRVTHAATLLADGSVLLVGGGEAADPTSSADLWLRSREIESWRPRITSAPSAAIPGTEVPLHGAGFRGVAEASGGWAKSSTNYPVPLWMPLEGPPVHGTLRDWTDTEATWIVPSTSHPGPGLLFIAVNGIQSVGVSVTVGRTPLGADCTASGACETGHCADGVCCDQACDGSCVACTADQKGGGVDGECGPLPSGLDEDLPCEIEPTETCGQNGLCDGEGHCATYANGVECRAGWACYEGECRGSYCDGDHTVSRLGAIEDCTPYRCSTVTHLCRTRCDSNLECADGAMCTTNHECATFEGDRAPGCGPACTVRRTPRSLGSLAAAGLLGVGLLLRRSRRRQHGSGPETHPG